MTNIYRSEDAIDFPNDPEENQVYVDDNNRQWKYSSNQWGIFEPYYITDCPDVDMTNVEVDDVIEWNGTKWVNVKESLDLESLGDVLLNTPSNDDFLVYDGSYWRNKEILPPVFCRVYKASQSNGYNYGEEMIITFDDILYDQNSMFTNYRITIPSDAIYSINAEYAGSTGNPQFALVKIKNSVGATIKEIHFAEDEYTGYGPTCQFHYFGYHDLNQGDYIQLYHIRSRRRENNNPATTFINFYLTVEQI